MTPPPVLPAHLLKFLPTMEHFEENEALTDEELNEQMEKIRETTLAHSGHAIRSVHAKSHGLLHGTLTVLDDLPAALAQGLFAQPASYSVVLRFSTLPGDILDDSVSTPRGVAMKVIGVTGDRLPGSEGDATQDFVLVNGPAFAAPTARKFLGNLKLLASTTDRGEGAKQVLSHIARATEAVLEAFGGKSPTLLTLGGQPAVHILGDSFYSQTPFLFGDHVAKFSLAPVSPELTVLSGAPLDIDNEPNALRQAVHDHFAVHGGSWEFRVQLATDLETTPIEDASAEWPKDQSPYIAVARVHCPPQDSWSAQSRTRIDDGMSFSPWHGLAAHRPLGSVNRVRKDTYLHSAAFRGAHTGCPMTEPKA